MNPTTPLLPAERMRQYWRRNLRLIGALLALWFVLTFGLCFFAADLHFSLFGWPFGFWAAAQGALLVYCLIIWYYAFAMERLDREYSDRKND
ncbi:MAG: DUF4212 domain-containing protein [Burkholderiales bacterium]|nr:DUF4212 domain-containing protein [Burkholderiales bacterium]